MKEFKERLVYYRKAAGYETAKDFAEVCGIPYQNYMNYENKGSEPKYSALCKIAKQLGISTDELIGNGVYDYDLQAEWSEAKHYYESCNINLVDPSKMFPQEDNVIDFIVSNSEIDKHVYVSATKNLLIRTYQLYKKQVLIDAKKNFFHFLMITAIQNQNSFRFNPNPFVFPFSFDKEQELTEKNKRNS